MDREELKEIVKQEIKSVISEGEPSEIGQWFYDFDNASMGVRKMGKKLNDSTVSKIWKQAMNLTDKLESHLDKTLGKGWTKK